MDEANSELEWVQKAREFLVRVIQRETPEKKTPTKSNARKSLETPSEESKTVVEELLPLVYKILPYLKHDQRENLVEVFFFCISFGNPCPRDSCQCGLPFLFSIASLNVTLQVFSALYLNSDAKSNAKLSCLHFLRSLMKVQSIWVLLFC